ncbi:MAG: hypothetical protein ACWA6X_01850 [Bauldia sp.]|jgi:hypothetical protein
MGRRFGWVAAIGVTVAASASAAADPAAVHAWIERERAALTAGASIELVRIEEMGSETTVFTIIYLPQRDVATVTCQPVFEYGWTCVMVRNAFVERELMLG